MTTIDKKLKQRLDDKANELKYLKTKLIGARLRVDIAEAEYKGIEIEMIIQSNLQKIRKDV